MSSPNGAVLISSIVTSTEALAISTLGVDHITIAAKVLQALAEDKEVKNFRGGETTTSAKDSGMVPESRTKGEECVNGQS